MSNNNSQPTPRRTSRRTLNQKISGLSLWKLSGRYSSYRNRVWTPNRPQPFQQSDQPNESGSQKRGPERH